MRFQVTPTQTHPSPAQHNPDGNLQPKNENNRIDALLQKELQSLDILHFRVTGGSKDMKHAEPGFGCVIDSSAARKLGQQFSQEAVFWVDDGELFLVNCNQEEPHIALGRFYDRVIAPATPPT